MGEAAGDDICEDIALNPIKVACVCSFCRILPVLPLALFRDISADWTRVQISCSF